MIDFIIVSNAANDELRAVTQKCIDTLFLSHPNSDAEFHVTVVESQPGVKWGRSYVSNEKGVETIYTDGEFNYHRFLNLGWKHRRQTSRAEWICFANNDLYFVRGWWEHMQEAMRAQPDGDSFSPICPLTQPQYGIAVRSGNYLGYRTRREVSGWCLITRPSTYTKMGGFDERFVYWYTDDDYAATLHSLKVKHYLATASIVEHHSRSIGITVSSNKDQYEKHDPNALYNITYGAKAVFDAKWGAT